MKKTQDKNEDVLVKKKVYYGITANQLNNYNANSIASKQNRSIKEKWLEKKLNKFPDAIFPVRPLLYHKNYLGVIGWRCFIGFDDCQAILDINPEDFFVIQKQLPLNV